MGLPHVACILSLTALALIHVSYFSVRLTGLIGLAQGVVALVVYYLLVVQMLVCFAQVCLTSPGRPKDLADKGLQSMVTGQTKTGKMMRLCNKCQCFKPDRCHHCSDCKACTLKMDHHCPWVNNCVGFHNYKYFVLFLINLTLCACYTIGLLIYVILERPQSDYGGWDISGLICVGLCGIFGFGCLGLMLYHLSLMIINQTTIEQLKSGDPAEFSLGVVENIRQVLGANVLIWFVPCVWGVSPEYDGVEWGAPQQTSTTVPPAAWAGRSATNPEPGVEMVCQVVQPTAGSAGSNANGANGSNGGNSLTGTTPGGGEAGTGEISLQVDGDAGNGNGHTNGGPSSVISSGSNVTKGPLSPYSAGGDLTSQAASPAAAQAAASRIPRSIL